MTCRFELRVHNSRGSRNSRQTALFPLPLQGAAAWSKLQGRGKGLVDVKLAASASQLGMGSYSDGPPNTSQMCQQNLFHDHAPPHSALPQSPPDCPKSQNDELSNRPFPRFPLPPFPSLFFIATGDVLVSSSSALLRHSSQNSRPRPPLRRRLNLHTNLRTLEILKEFLTPVVNRGVQVATGCCTTIETDTVEDLFVRTTVGY